MKKAINSLFVMFVFFSCQKKEYHGKNDIRQVKYNKNINTYPSAKIDSIQAMENITRQKMQELFDLSTLYASGNKDTEIDSVIYEQMKTYFLNPDSTKIRRFIFALDSLKVHYAKIENLRIEEKADKKDTLNLAKFRVDYYNADKKYLGTESKEVEYILKKNPVKFKKEFKFYFLDFN